MAREGLAAVRGLARNVRSPSILFCIQWPRELAIRAERSSFSLALVRPDGYPGGLGL
jgi:hypothetical protein